VFAHGVFRLNEVIGLTGGLRYTHNTKTFTYDHIGSGFPALTQDAVTKRVDWTVGVDVRATPNQLFYGTISTGFRPRTVNPRPLTPRQFQSIPGEDLISYEIGAKGDYLDHHLRVNLAAFYSDYKSHLRSLNGFECVGSTQDVVFDPTQCAVGSSAVTWFYYVGEKAKIYGLEGEITAEPVRGLLLNGTFGRNKFKSSGTGVAYFDPSNRIQPNFNASASIQYEIPAPGGMLTPRLDWRYQTMMSYNPNPGAPSTALFEVPAFSVFDARLAYKMDNGWQASLAVTNLFDKFYYSPKFALTGFNVSGVPSPPREFLVSLKRTF
jgi:iron complex outermembrane receptor protein